LIVQAAKGRIAAMKLSSVVDFPIEGLDLGPHVAKRSNKAIENGLHNGGLNQASSPINGCFGLGNWKHRASFKKHFVSSTHNNKSANGNAQGTSDESMLYDLYAVCNHHGKDVLGGHYTGMYFLALVYCNCFQFFNHCMYIYLLFTVVFCFTFNSLLQKSC